jgi:hypothetical protein
LACLHLGPLFRRQQRQHLLAHGTTLQEQLELSGRDLIVQVFQRGGFRIGLGHGRSQGLTGLLGRCALGLEGGLVLVSKRLDLTLLGGRKIQAETTPAFAEASGLTLTSALTLAPTRTLALAPALGLKGGSQQKNRPGQGQPTE